MVEGKEDASDIFLKISRAVKKFLDKELHYLGYIQKDDHLVEAIRAQQPVVEKFPASPCGKDFLKLTKAVVKRVSQMETRKEKKFKLDF
jgi:flagellar biosynthesis protein FlhG